MGSGYIFVSYRRDDSAGYTRAICDKLAERFSKDRIFMDVDSIEPGVPFDEVISAAVGRCDVLLAMIGKRWLEARDGSGPRIDNPKDFVRIEIAAALSRNIRVIPVLLDDAKMPAADALPEPVRPLAFRNAIEISGDSGFAVDVDRLADAVGKAVGQTWPPGSRRRMLTWLLGTAAVVTLASTAGIVLRRPATTQNEWRFCQKCQSLFFNGNSAKGVCPAGDGHIAAGFDFILTHDVAGPGQPDWRSCGKCSTLFYDGYAKKGVCPAGGGHAATGFNFVVTYDSPGPGQQGWRFCQKCQSMFFDGYPAKGTCPAGEGHVAAGYKFVLPYDEHART